MTRICHNTNPLVIAVLCLSSLLITSNAAAQSGGFFDMIKQVTESGSTPAKASMNCGLDSPVNKITGAACFDIPIYTIETGGHSLPVSLHYESSGFKVVDLASNVGMGWNIAASGMITRTVKGFPDELFCGYTAQDDPTNPNQGSDSIRRLVSELVGKPLDTILTDRDSTLFVALMGITENRYEGEPDIYSFSFAGYSGSFVHDMDGNIHLIPEQNFAIEHVADTFIVTVDNGDRYYFGGENATETVQYTFNVPLFEKVSTFELNQINEVNNYYENRYLFLDKQQTREDCQNYSIAWNLTKIEYADSQAGILFEYDRDTVRCYIGTDETYLMGQRFTNHTDFQLENGHDWVVQRINRYRFSLVPRLRRIKWDNGRIDFVPSPGYREDMNFREDQQPRTYGGRSIDRIVVSSMEDGDGGRDSLSVELKKSYFRDFNTILPSPNGHPIKFRSYYKRLRLDTIVYMGKNNERLYKYYFLYNMKDPSYCCSRNSCEIDCWGYYKPREENNAERLAIKPRLYYYSNGKEDPLYNSVYSVWRRNGDVEPDCVLDGHSDMLPDPIGSMEFTLKDVILPTGGVLEFEYEPNEFLFDGEDRIGPGVRVKHVTYTGENHFVNWYKRKYFYSDGSHSSGRISSIPNIGYYNYAPILNYGQPPASSSDCYRVDYLTSRQVSTVTDMRGCSESSVKYGKVTEGYLKGNSVGRTVFTNQVGFTASDSVMVAGNEVFVRKTKLRRSRCYAYPNLWYMNNPYYHNVEHKDSSPDFTFPLVDWCNGFTTKTEHYDDSNNLVESTEYKYRLVPDDDSVFYIQAKYITRNEMVFDHFNILYGQSFQLPSYEYDILWGVNYYRTGILQLDTVIHRRYDDSGQLANVVTKSYDYNELHYVSQETTNDSDGRLFVSRFSYPFHYADWSSSPVFREMTLKNMLNNVVEQYHTVDGKTVDGTLYRYASIGNGRFIKPDSVLTLRNDGSLSDFQPFSQQGMDSRYKLSASVGYDSSSGNIVALTDEREGLTVFVWGGHNGLLLAKVKNATLSEVEGALPCTLEALQGKTDPDELVGIFQTLRSSLPKAMVTSYTYDLFQKLTSVTDPSGKTNRFEYDSFERLRLTRDAESNIVNIFDYHYHK